MLVLRVGHVGGTLQSRRASHVPEVRRVKTVGCALSLPSCPLFQSPSRSDDYHTPDHAANPTWDTPEILWQVELQDGPNSLLV